MEVRIAGPPHGRSADRASARPACEAVRRC
jgi:hypothetical protein